MFSALTQGSPIYIIDKTDGLKFRTGEVVGLAQNTFGNTFNNTAFTPNGSVTIKVKIDNAVIDYPEAPRNGSIASYNNGNTFVCETKDCAISQIEKILQHTKQVILDIPKYQQLEQDCENTLKEISPIYAKDKEREDRINNLDTKVSSMEGKLDKILSALSKQ